MALYIRKSNYSNGRLALRLLDDSGIPYCNITTNMSELPLPQNHVFLDNKIVPGGSMVVYPDVLEALESNSILRRTGVTRASSQSFYTFHEAELLELDVDGYELISEELELS